MSSQSKILIIVLVKEELMATAQQNLAAKLANKMTNELMEVTRLSREDCQHILMSQLTGRYSLMTAELLDESETTFMAEVLH